MSRYTNDLPLNKPVDFVQFMMNDYLSKNGFSTAEWKGQPVYRAGDPMLEGYKFMTWSYINGVLHVEAWLKGLFGGEMGLTGFVGCLQKKPFKQSLEQLYTLMRQDIPTDQMNAGAAGIAGGTANAGAVPVTTVNNTSAATISLIFGILGCLTGLLVPIAGLVSSPNRRKPVPGKGHKSATFCPFPCLFQCTGILVHFLQALFICRLPADIRGIR